MHPFLLRSYICVHFSPEENLETPTRVPRNLTDRLRENQMEKNQASTCFSLKDQGVQGRSHVCRYIPVYQASKTDCKTSNK